MPDIHQLFQTISERIPNTATIKTVFGDPISAEGRTVIPVARVRWGFGGGGGSNEGDDDGEKGPGSQGSGGGGGIEVNPIGYIKITPLGSSYVSFEERRRAVRALLILGVLALFFLRRRKKEEIGGRIGPTFAY